MARLKKNKRGYYVKTFTYEGKRYRVYGKDQEELFEKVKQKRQELVEALDRKEHPSLIAYYEIFSRSRANVIKGATIRAQQYQFKNIASVQLENGMIFGDMMMKDITKNHLEYVREKLLKEGKTPENLNICFAHLSHVFESAVLDDIVQKNPCKALLKLKRVSELISENKHRALTEEESERFLEASEYRNSFYRNCFKLMLLTGMRIGEVGALYLTDIDDNFIHIRRTITRDENGNYLVGNDTKTYSGVRDFPLGLCPELREVIKKQKELNNMIFGLGWSGTLFQSTEGQLLREYTVNREINRICKESDVEKFTCHCFRSTFATNFTEKHPERYLELAYLMGHKYPTITFKHYTRVKPEEIVKVVNG